jgi:hypothetical protein
MDLLLAIAKVLNRLKDSEVLEEGVFLVLTPNAGTGSGGYDDWKDKSTNIEIGTRIKNLLRGLNSTLTDVSLTSPSRDLFLYRMSNGLWNIAQPISNLTWNTLLPSTIRKKLANPDFLTIRILHAA